MANDQVPGCSPPQRAALGTQSLQLLVKCLGFDFIGTNPDESGDDVGTIQAKFNSVCVFPTALPFDFFRRRILLGVHFRYPFQARESTAKFNRGSSYAYMQLCRLHQIWHNTVNAVS